MEQADNVKIHRSTLNLIHLFLYCTKLRKFKNRVKSHSYSEKCYNLYFRITLQHQIFQSKIRRSCNFNRQKYIIFHF